MFRYSSNIKEQTKQFRKYLDYFRKFVNSFRTEHFCSVVKIGNFLLFNYERFLMNKVCNKNSGNILLIKNLPRNWRQCVDFLIFFHNKRHVNQIKNTLARRNLSKGNNFILAQVLGKFDETSPFQIAICPFIRNIYRMLTLSFMIQLSISLGMKTLKIMHCYNLLKLLQTS